MQLKFAVPSCATASKLGASLFLATSLFLAGCSADQPIFSTPATVAVSGNWQISSTSQSAAALPALSGELSGNSTAISGILHSDSISSCVAPSTLIPVTGSANAENAVTLTGTNVAGGKLTINGTLAADGKSISDASYTVMGGTCAFAAPVAASALQYANIDGTYNGSFYDTDSSTAPVLTMQATLSQSPDSSNDGNFTLTGQMTTGANPCFSVPTQLTSATVTGGSFTMVYSDSSTGNSVTAGGTFAPNGQTLTITNWQLTGPCGPDSGTGTMTLAGNQ